MSAIPIRLISSTPIANFNIAVSLQPVIDELSALRNPFHAACARQMSAADEATQQFAAVEDFLAVAASMDRQYPPSEPVPVDGIDVALNQALDCLRQLYPWFERLNFDAHDIALQRAEIGIAHWAMCRGIAIRQPEGVVNALAASANDAQTRQATAAVFALMQGLVAHLHADFSADLERSNPDRVWRILNLNFAITAIRSADPAMMRHAFDALNENLPGERAGFYADALKLAENPGVSAEVRGLIEAEYRRWTDAH